MFETVDSIGFLPRSLTVNFDVSELEKTKKASKYYIHYEYNKPVLLPDIKGGITVYCKFPGLKYIYLMKDGTKIDSLRVFKRTRNWMAFLREGKLDSSYYLYGGFETDSSLYLSNEKIKEKWGKSRNLKMKSLLDYMYADTLNFDVDECEMEVRLRYVDEESDIGERTYFAIGLSGDNSFMEAQFPDLGRYISTNFFLSGKAVFGNKSNLKNFECDLTK